MDDILKELTKLLEVLFKYFTPFQVVSIIGAILVVLFAYKIYTDWAKRNETNKALEAKDQSIQILNEENRMFRIKMLKDIGWSDETIDNFILKELPRNPIEARQMVRNGKAKKTDETASNKKE